MVKIRPFRAVRPTPERAADVAALPYDVMTSEEARVMAGDKPYSFLHIDRAEIDLPAAADPYSPQVYERAKENLEKQIADGVFLQDETPLFYVYRLTMDGRAQTGLVCCASVDDYEAGVIKKHELARADKEEDRVRHVDALDANTGPIFLASPENAALSAALAERTLAAPVYDFVSDDGVRHEVWTLPADANESVSDMFARTDALYIADGHHRCASAARVGKLRRQQCASHTGDEEFNYFLAVVFPADQLEILDYNRVVKDLNGLDENVFFDRLREKFEIEPCVGKLRRQQCASHTGDAEFNYFLAVVFPADQLEILDYNRVVKDLNGLDENAFFGRLREKFEIEPCAGAGPVKSAEKHTFGMYLNGKWYLLKARAGIFDASDPVARLDVSILQDNVLAPVLGVSDPRVDKRVDFVGGIRGLGELERRANSDMKVAFAMFPTTMDDLMAIADAGLIMPPKSTWFEPKLRSGLFIHKLSD